LTEKGAILPFRVKWVKTDLTTALDVSNQYPIVLSELMGPTPGHNQAVVVDFVDAEIGVLDVSAKKWLSAYRSLVATS
jgi:hypothetical protein